MSYLPLKGGLNFLNFKDFPIKEDIKPSSRMNSTNGTAAFGSTNGTADFESTNSSSSTASIQLDCPIFDDHAMKMVEGFSFWSVVRLFKTVFFHLFYVGTPYGASLTVFIY